MSAELAVAPEVPCIAEVDNVRVFVSEAAGPLPSTAPAATPSTQRAAGTLQLFDLGASAGTRPQYYLQLGDWTYVLCGQPVLRVAPCQYLLPDLDDAAAPPVLLALPPDSEAFIEEILAESCVVRGRDVGGTLVSKDTWTLADGIVRAGEAVGTGVVTAATYLGEGIKWSGDKLTTVTAPLQERVVVSEGTKAAIASAKTAVGSVATFSFSLLSLATSAAAAVGQYASDRFRESSVGQRVFGAGLDANDPANAEAVRRRAAVAAVAASSVLAVMSVWEGLENAAKVIVKDSSHAVSTVVTHRYGAEAGAVARDVGGIVVGATATMVNVRRIGVRPFARASAVAAMRCTVRDSAQDGGKPDPSKK